MIHLNIHKGEVKQKTKEEKMGEKREKMGEEENQNNREVGSRKLCDMAPSTTSSDCMVCSP